MKPDLPQRLVFVNRVFFPDTAATSRLLSDLTVDMAADCPVLVICSRTTPRPAERLHPAVEVLRIPWGRIAERGILARAWRDVFFLGAVFWVLLWRLRRHDVLIAKTDPPFLHWVASLAATLRRVRHGGWHQDLFPEVPVGLGLWSERGWLNRGLSWLRDRALRKASFNVAISVGMGEYLSCRGPVTVISNWALSERAPDAEAVQAWRGSLLPGDAMLLAHSGNLGRVHPLEPFRQLLLRTQDNPGLHILCSGGGYHYEQLRGEFDKLARCHFLPFQPEQRLPELLALADVHLVLLEPQMQAYVVPSKLLGILAAGRPVAFIGDTQGDIAAMLRSSGAGLVFAPDEVDLLIDAITELQQDRSRLAAMGQAAVRLYQERFARTLALRQWRELLSAMEAGRKSAL